MDIGIWFQNTEGRVTETPKNHHFSSTVTKVSISGIYTVVSMYISPVKQPSSLFMLLILDTNNKQYLKFLEYTKFCLT